MTLTTKHVELQAGETLRIGGVAVTLVEKSGKRARLTVRATRETPITTHPSAHECASLPTAKEHPHGKHPV